MRGAHPGRHGSLPKPGRDRAVYEWAKLLPSHAAVAERFNITKARVSQIVRKLKKLEQGRRTFAQADDNESWGVL